MDFLTEDISRIKEIMGIEELSEENNAKEGEIEEQEDSGGGETGGSTSSAKSWESGRKMGKTYSGPKYVWKSDRTMGKTYSGDPKSKWESGASRGKANPLT
jgi:hypothetical protein